MQYQRLIYTFLLILSFAGLNAQITGGSGNCIINVADPNTVTELNDQSGEGDCKEVHHATNGNVWWYNHSLAVGSRWFLVDSEPDISIPTTADFATLSGKSVGTTMVTTGFATVADGGAARYELKAAGTVDNISVFATEDGLFAELLLNYDGGIEIAQLGAFTDDGVFDDPVFNYAVNKYNYIYSNATGIFDIENAITLKSDLHIKLSPYTEMLMRVDLFENFFTYLGGARINNVTIEGGVYDYNDLGVGAKTSNAGSITTDVHGFVITNVDDLHIKDLKLLNVPRAALHISGCSGVHIGDIEFDTPNGDGLDLIGPSDNVHIYNFSGIVGDDGIFIGGNAWTNVTAGYEGNVNDVLVENINLDAGINIMSVYPGKNIATDVSYTVDNIVIKNLSGSAGLGNIISLNQSDPLNPIQAPLSKGIITNVTIDHISGDTPNSRGINMNMEKIRNVKLSNVFFNSNQKITVTEVAIDYLSIDGIYATSGQILPVLEVTSLATVGVIDINKMFVTYGTGLSFRGVTINTPTDLSISNSKFIGTNTSEGIHVDGSGDIHLNNVELHDHTNAINLIQTNDLHLNDVKVTSSVRGVLANGAASNLTVRNSSYNFTGNQEDAYFELSGGSITIADGIDSKHFYQATSTNQTIPAGYVDGHEMRYKNISVGNNTLTPTGETIDGATSFVLAPNKSVTLIKRGGNWDSFNGDDGIYQGNGIMQGTGDRALDMSGITDVVFNSTNAGENLLILNQNNATAGANVIKGFELQRLNTERIGMYFTVDAQPPWIGSKGNRAIGIRTNNQLMTQFNEDGSVIIGDYANVLADEFAGLDVRKSLNGLHMIIGSPEVGNEDGGVIGFRRADGALSALFGHTNDNQEFWLDNATTGGGSLHLRFNGDAVGTNNGFISIENAEAEVFNIDRLGQIKAPFYVADNSFTLAAPVGQLVFDANGNVGTAAIGSSTDDQNATEVLLSPAIDVDGDAVNETTVQEAITDLSIIGVQYSQVTPTYTLVTGTGTLTAQPIHCEETANVVECFGNVSYTGYVADEAFSFEMDALPIAVGGLSGLDFSGHAQTVKADNNESNPASIAYLGPTIDFLTQATTSTAGNVISFGFKYYKN